ncbi:hypothetical protein [Thermosulfidibacter takaii]|uniref:hypothetical protein n=1 Tax=Thermosulfidibacter takaii TaxID=412593 RepID=UPI00130D9EEB|nr:hypothetical protein [Thermosulfidibacter takaii]
MFTSFLLFACGGKFPIVYKSQSLKKKRVCKLAVLPFYDETRYPMGGLFLYRIFIAKLVERNKYDVVTEGDVRRIMIQQKLLPGETPGLEFYLAIVENLGVDAVITGRVVEMEEVKEKHEVIPKLAFWLEVRDARNGEVLWSTYHKRSGEYYRKIMHFGVIHTLTALAAKMFDEVLDEWEKEVLEECRR